MDSLSSLSALPASKIRHTRSLAMLHQQRQQNGHHNTTTAENLCVLIKTRTTVTDRSYLVFNLKQNRCTHITTELCATGTQSRKLLTFLLFSELEIVWNCFLFPWNCFLFQLDCFLFHSDCFLCTRDCFLMPNFHSQDCF